MTPQPNKPNNSEKKSEVTVYEVHFEGEMFTDKVVLHSDYQRLQAENEDLEKQYEAANMEAKDYCDEIIEINSDVEKLEAALAAEKAKVEKLQNEIYEVIKYLRTREMSETYVAAENSLGAILRQTDFKLTPPNGDLKESAK